MSASANAQARNEDAMGWLRRLPLLQVGFRPFFLLGAAWAAVGLGLWLSVLAGLADVGGPYGPIAWHAHEMVYGFAAAVLAGFLLTAVPGWTGRPKLRPAGLAGLAGIWIAGRLAMAGAGLVGAPLAAATDMLFLLLLFGWAATQIVSTGNWRNLPIAVAPAALLVGNLLFHLEAFAVLEAGSLSYRLGIAIYVLLVAVIGGRIIPTFTRNWLQKREPGRLPAQPGRLDMAVVLLTLLSLGLWVAVPESRVLAPVAGVAAVGHLVRLARWCGWRTLSEPLVWILHLGYLWMPVGLGLVAAASLAVVPATAALHALTGGVIATMMLAIMTRATLGHTGRPLTADAATTATYALLFLAVVGRVAAPLAPELTTALLTASGLLWIAAFLLYLAVYAPKLWGEPVHAAPQQPR